MASQQAGGGCKKKKRPEAKKARQAMRTAMNKDRRAKQRKRKEIKRAAYICPADRRNAQFKADAFHSGCTLKEYRTKLKREAQ